jgi:hypothetical protein
MWGLAAMMAWPPSSVRRIGRPCQLAAAIGFGPAAICPDVFVGMAAAGEAEAAQARATARAGVVRSPICTPSTYPEFGIGDRGFSRFCRWYRVTLTVIPARELDGTSASRAP